MAATITSFRLRLPEYSDTVEYPNDKINFYLNDAKLFVGANERRWGDAYDYAQSFMAAHLLSMAERAEVGDKNVSSGPITSKSADGVSVGRANMFGAMGINDAFYMSTTYGQRFLMIRNRTFAPILTAGCPTSNNYEEEEKDPIMKLRSNGFGIYHDESSNVVPVNLTANQWIEIPNDGLGVHSDTSNLPTDVLRLLDTNTGYLDLSQLEVGDQVFVKSHISVSPNFDNALLEFRVMATDLGIEQEVARVLNRLDSGSGEYYTFVLAPDLILLDSELLKNNPIKLQIRLSCDGIFRNAGTSIGVVTK